MGIPSDDDFNRAIEALDSFDAHGSLKELYILNETESEEIDYRLKHGDIQFSPTIENIEKFADAVFQVINQKAVQIKTMPAVSWLRKQYSYSLATKNVLGYTPNFDTFSNDYREYIVDKLSEGLKEHGYEGDNHSKFQSKISFYVNMRHGDYLKGVLSAFQRYFYTEIDSYRENIQSAKTQAEKAKSHIDTLIDIEETLSIFPELNRNLGNMNYEKIIRLLKRTSLELGYISNGDNNSYNPIQKHDERAKERMLIFCLWRHFRKYKNSSNTTAISNMLTIEGVENQITQRAIDNLISKWKLPPPTIEIYEDSSEVEPDERTQLREKLKLRF